MRLTRAGEGNAPAVAVEAQPHDVDAPHPAELSKLRRCGR